MNASVVLGGKSMVGLVGGAALALLIARSRALEGVSSGVFGVSGATIGALILSVKCDSPRGMSNIERIESLQKDKTEIIRFCDPHGRQEVVVGIGDLAKGIVTRNQGRSLKPFDPSLIAYLAGLKVGGGPDHALSVAQFCEDVGLDEAMTGPELLACLGVALPKMPTDQRS